MKRNCFACLSQQSLPHLVSKLKRHRSGQETGRRSGRRHHAARTSQGVCMGRESPCSARLDGCVAVTNEEMDEIWNLVRVGTPIEIKPSTG
jgi:hypothetical protein